MSEAVPESGSRSLRPVAGFETPAAPRADWAIAHVQRFRELYDYDADDDDWEEDDAADDDAFGDAVAVTADLDRVLGPRIVGTRAET